MKLKASGDPKLMQQWQKQLASVPELLSQMSRDMGEEALELIAEGFATETDPYGKRWQDKKVDDGRSILVGKTARLRRGWHLQRYGRSGFTIAPSVNYAGFHQKGTKRMVARMMVPSRSRGMPPKWRTAMNSVAQAHFAAHFGGKARGAGMGIITAKLAGVKRRFNAAALLRKVMKKIAGE
jgi:phage gpG-like protein